MGALGASDSLRRWHVAALAALGALLLLLLANHAPMFLASSDIPVSQPQHTSAHSPGSASQASNTTAVPGPRMALVRDLYEAGHERPHPELCPELGAHLRLLVLVTSAPSHASARDAVRLTWGHYAARRDIALAFVLGASPPDLRPALDAEDALYGDLVIGHSVDSYSNLTLKTLSILEWADTYCPRVSHLLKTDDDMFINVPFLLRFAAERENATRTIWGKVLKNSPPNRSSTSKYYVPPLQFPGLVFPDFAIGAAYLMTTDAVRSLLKAAPEEIYLRMEDVFVTGVLAAKLGVTRSHAPEFYNERVFAKPCAVQRGIAIHMVQYHEQFYLWSKLLDGKTKSTYYTDIDEDAIVRFIRRAGDTSDRNLVEYNLKMAISHRDSEAMVKKLVNLIT